VVVVSVVVVVVVEVVVVVVVVSSVVVVVVVVAVEEAVVVVVVVVSVVVVVVVEVVVVVASVVVVVEKEAAVVVVVVVVVVMVVVVGNCEAHFTVTTSVIPTLVYNTSLNVPLRLTVVSSPLAAWWLRIVPSSITVICDIRLDIGPDHSNVYSPVSRLYVDNSRHVSVPFTTVHDTTHTPVVTS